jgi:hypothetical protein
MSSISAKIASISKAPSDSIPAILTSISESMSQSPLSETEMDQLCNVITAKLPTAPPALFRAIFSLCIDILGSQSYPPTFVKSLITILKSQLASQKKPTRDAFLEFSEKLIAAITPDTFWDQMQDSFVSKSAQMKESALVLMKFSLETYPEFKIAKMIRSVFASLADPSPILRGAAYAVAAVLYERAPETVEKVLRAQFLTRADDMIAKLKGDVKPQKKQRQPLTVQRPAELESEASLTAEFDSPYPETRALSDACPFERLAKTLGRSTDWEKRAEGLELLVAHARGAPRPEAFVRDFRTVQDGFVDCLTDTRSALLKQACLCLAAMAAALRGALDMCSDWLIPPLLAKTNHGTGVVSMASALAVMRFVAFVCGRRIAKVLADNSENPSVEVRVTVVKCMFIARESWVPDLCAGFQEILFLKQRDQSERVRALCVGIDERPIRPEAVIAEEESVPEPEPQEEKTLVQLIQEKDTAGIERLIAQSNPKPELIGRMQDVIDLVIMDLNEEEGIDVAISLLDLLCTHYGHSLYPFLTQLLLDLPEDEERGIRCLEHMSRVFGKLPLARLLRKSNLACANAFMLSVAEEVVTDADFQCRTVLAVILNGFYERFHNLIIFLLKRVYPTDPRKCEALLASIPVQDRNELLTEIQDQIPQLYNAFATEATNELTDKLIKEIEKAKVGHAIDFELIKSVRDNDTSNLLLGICAIRECQNAEDEFIPYLIGCTQHNDPSVVGAASKALRTTCQKNVKAVALIAEAFVATPTAFKALAHALQFAPVSDAAAALERLQDPIVKSVRDPVLKYSALSVLANAVSCCGDEYRRFGGDLSPINLKLLETMIPSERLGIAQ